MSKILVLHHNDADGFGAAFALHKALHDENNELTFVEVQYGQEPPELVLSGLYDSVLILDFSYKREIMEALYEANRGHLLCIDHHKTAQADLEGLPYCIFNMEKSGAVLTWEYCFDVPAPPILQYVQDRDLWKFELPYSKEVNAYIATLPDDFEDWNHFALNTAVQVGSAILAFQNEQIQRRLEDVKLAMFVNVAGEPGVLKFIPVDETVKGAFPYVCASDNISELGDAMCRAYPDAPFSMSYCDRPNGMRSYSLRSRNGFDVSVVAKAFGGGGHPGAAGFTLPAPAVFK